MNQAEYTYELLMTRADDTHVYAVFAEGAGRIGTTASVWEKRQKRWGVEASYGNRGADGNLTPITRTFAKRTDAANVMHSFWRDWRAKLDAAQGVTR